MSAILEDAAVRRQVFPVSVDFYHQAGEFGLLGEDVELLEGIIVKKMPKSPLHTFVVAALEELLRRCAAPDQLVRKEDPLTLHDSEPEPDLALVRGTRRDFMNAHPTTAELVIEVAVSTEELDHRKGTIYARAGVKEYWLVEPEPRRVTLFREPAGTSYCRSTILSANETASSEIVAGFNVRLADLFPS